MTANIIKGGSSPLARGTFAERAGRGLDGRLIPARAGNISRPVQWSCHCTAHPRSRGEHNNETLGIAGLGGSSPLARGTCGPHDCFGGLARLIPARAGNIVRAPPGGADAQAHPRSRGEHANTAGTSGRMTGSSPLARGTLTEGTGRGVVVMAHPRSRGEH